MVRCVSSAYIGKVGDSRGKRFGSDLFLDIYNTAYDSDMTDKKWGNFANQIKTVGQKPNSWYCASNFLFCAVPFHHAGVRWRAVLLCGVLCCAGSGGAPFWCVCVCMWTGAAFLPLR